MSDQPETSGLQDATSSVQDSLHSAQSSVQDSLHGAQSSVQDSLHSAQSTLQDTGAQVQARVDERPELAVGAAFGGGVLFALILKRLAR